jgi:hypothetical protein
MQTATWAVAEMNCLHVDFRSAEDGRGRNRATTLCLSIHDGPYGDKNPEYPFVVLIAREGWY